MATKIKPTDLANLSLAQYQKLLEKDMARLARSNKWVDYVLVTFYKFGSKKSGLLLFTAPDDKQWSAIIETAKANGKKFASGKMKVKLMPDKNQNGVDDLLLVVKTAEGQLAVQKVAEYLSEDMFGGDPDVQAMTAKDAKIEDDEEDGESEDSETTAKHLIEHADTTAQNLDAAALVTANKDIALFADKLKIFSQATGGVQQLQTKVQEQLKSLKVYDDMPHDHKDYKTKALVEAQEAFNWLDGLEEDVQALISIAETTIAKISKSVKGVFQTPEFKKNLAFLTEQSQNARRILRFLVQAQDFIEEKYLDDHESEDSQDTENSMRIAQDFLKQIMALNAQYQKYKADAEKAAYPLIDLVTKINAYNNLAPQYRKPEYQAKLDTMLKQIVAAQIENNKVRLNQGLGLDKDSQDIADFDRAAKLADSDSLTDWQTAEGLVSPLLEKYKTKDVNYTSIFKDLLVAVKQKINAALREKAFSDLLEKARNKSGGLTPANLFDVFMSEFRGKVTYTPNFINGSVITGTKSANCENLAGAFKGLAEKAGLKAKNPKVASNFITIPVDNQWIDSTAPGNLNTEGFDNSRRYFFDGHWVTEIGGDWFCPTTGRSGKSNVQATIFGHIDDKKQTCTVSGRAVKFVPGENNGFDYSLVSE
jgi:hypothetical protein